jgi:hypothetical protein
MSTLAFSFSRESIRGEILGPVGVLVRAMLYPGDWSARVGLEVTPSALSAEAYEGSVDVELPESRTAADAHDFGARVVAEQTDEAFDASTQILIVRGFYGYVVGGQWSKEAPVSGTAYLSTTQMISVAATLPGMSALIGSTTDAQASLLEQASLDVDAAGPYQGRKYDPSQEREFPRVPYPASGDATLYGATSAAGAVLGDLVWDWDADTNAAVTPLNVKKAIAYQAAFLLTGAAQEAANRQAAIVSGLSSQSVSGMSESYQPGGAAGASGRSLLAPRALQLLRPYFLKTGKLL